MNAKQISCLLLFILIVVLGQLTFTLQEKYKLALDDEAAEEAKYKQAVSNRELAQGNYDATKRKTAASRLFLREWKPVFDKADNEIKAKAAFFAELVPKGKTLVSDKGVTPQAVANRDMSYVARRVTGSAKIIGDFHQLKDLIAQIETNMPTSRISSLEISKAQRASDVEVSISVDMPLTAEAKTTP